MFLAAAFLLGLTGSLHCVGMCGPLMMAASGRGGGSGVAAYQAGRIMVYMLLGLILGSLGWGMALWNAQSTVAIISGALLIGVALFRLDPGNLMQKWPAYNRFQLRIRHWSSATLGKGGVRPQLALGCCNGLLPCGLVYLAVIGAANTGSPAAGAAFMAAFGLGTVPLLAVTLYAGRRLFRFSSARLAILTPLVTVAAGLLLLYRGWVTHVPDGFVSFQELVFPTMCH